MSKKRVVKPCALCLEVRELCRSHVLPEFMYSKSYDDDGTFISLSSHPQRRARAFQVGAREHLLCSDCETILSTYEAYAAELLRAIDALPDSGEKGAVIEYEYRRFKLFGLSLLWRAHVATLHEYRSFSVGPLAEDIRLMLLRGEPGPKRICPFAIVRLLGSEMAQQTIVVPANLKQNGQHVVLLIAFGYSWYFVTSRQSHAIPSWFPMVGYTDQLMIPFDRTTDKRFITWLKTKMPPEMLS